MKYFVLAIAFTVVAYFASGVLGLTTGHLVFLVPTEGAFQAWGVQFLFLALKSAVVAGVFGYLTGRFVPYPPFPLGVSMGVAIVLPETYYWPGFLDWASDTFSIPLGGHLAMYGYWLATPFLYWFFVSVGARTKPGRHITRRSSRRQQAGAA